DHAVKRHVIGFLTIEQQVAGQGTRYVPGNAMGVELSQRLHVCELGKAAVGQVRGFEWALDHAEKIRAERRVWIVIRANGIASVEQRDLRFGGPAGVVEAQGFAVSIPDESGAIDDFGRPSIRRLEVLCLSEEGEPAAKYPLIAGTEAEEVGRAVTPGIDRRPGPHGHRSNAKCNRAAGQKGPRMPRPDSPARRYASPAETTSSTPRPSDLKMVICSAPVRPVLLPATISPSSAWIRSSLCERITSPD